MSQSSVETMLFINGIDGSTGDYDIPPFNPERLSGILAGAAAPDNFGELRQRSRGGEAHYGVKAAIDPERLDQAGWGVIFPASVDPAIIEALQPLLNWRRNQAGDRFRLFKGEEGVQPGEGKSAWLARHGVAPGPADPLLMPYYLMLVGDPEQITFNFQYQLDVQYAVGRLDLETPEDYAAYAETVLASERGEFHHKRRASFLGVENPDDRATQLSSSLLVQPLADSLSRRFQDWDVMSFTGNEAVKGRLVQELTDNAPALLFSASHGMSFPNGDARQAPHQGALLCGEWPGPKNWREPIPQDFYLAGDDLASSTYGLRGMLAFCHACFGAGVPPLDNFSLQLMRARKALAPKPFVSKLPQRLLSHRKGGALAVISHVDRAWSYSFEWPQAGRQTAVYESALTTLLEGKPVGLAMEYFNTRYAELATSLTEELEEIEFGKIPNHHELTAIWTAHNDARSYVVLGDPAVRLVPEGKSREHAREMTIVIEPAPTPPPAATAKPEPVIERPAVEEPLRVLPPEPQLELNAEAWLERLNRAAKSLEHIEVATRREGDNTPIATTRIDLDGKVEVVLGQDDNEPDWRRHQESVRLAMEQRTALLAEICRIVIDKK